MPPRRRPSTLTSLLAASLALGAIQGCGTPPSIPEAQPRGLSADYQTGYPVEPGHAREMGYDVRWVREIGLAPGQAVTHLIQNDGLLVTIESPDNMVTAIDPQNGKVLWKSIVGGRLETLAGMTADRRSVYINSTSRLFTLSRQSGNIKRIVDLEYPVNTSPLKLGQLAIFGSEVGNVFAHHLDDGYTRWAYGLHAPINSTPVLDEQQLFAVDSDGHYAKLSAKEGELLWRGKVYAGVSASPILHDGFVLLASEDQSLYSLASVTGADRWPAFRSESMLTVTPVAADQQVFINEPGRGLSAVDATTGERQWFYEQDVHPYHADGKRVVAAGNRRLVSLDHATGRVKAAVPTLPLSHIQADETGRLLLLTLGGELIQIAPSARNAPLSAVPQDPYSDAE